MRDAILHAARDLLPTLDEIAATVNISRRQLNAYFTSDLAVYRAMMQSYEEYERPGQGTAQGH